VPTATFGVQTADNANTTSYISGAFTPAAGDLLFALVAASGTIAAAPTMTDSQSLGFDRIANQLYNTVDTIYVFVARKLAANSSMTVTFDCSADASTGVITTVYRIASMDVLSRYRQVKTASGAAGTTPTCVMGLAVNTNSTVIGIAANEANPATLTQPASWSESGDTGTTLPTMGVESAHRASGETLTTLAWGSSSATAWGAAIVEVRPLVQPPYPYVVPVGAAVKRGANY
jgi:hypothetical protein